MLSALECFVWAHDAGGWARVRVSLLFGRCLEGVLLLGEGFCVYCCFI
jgi:hypothetical protein